jgi:hypothetical protein
VKLNTIIPGWFLINVGIVLFFVLMSDKKHILKLFCHDLKHAIVPYLLLSISILQLVLFCNDTSKKHSLNLLNYTVSVKHLIRFIIMLYNHTLTYNLSNTVIIYVFYLKIKNNWPFREFLLLCTIRATFFDNTITYLFIWNRHA